MTAGESAAGDGVRARFVALIRVVHPRPPAAEEAIDNDRLKRRAAFAAGVEYVARTSGAMLPLSWEDDGVTLVIPGEDARALPTSAFRVAELIWQRAKIDLDWPVRVAAHVARVRSIDETDADFKAEVERCCQSAAAPPVAALSVTEDVGLALSDDIREGLVRLRSSAGESVYMVGGAQSNGTNDPVGVLSDSLRKYVRGGDFARLRYVGFRLQRKEPPSLDVREVFVPQHVRLRRGSRKAAPGRAEEDARGATEEKTDGLDAQGLAVGEGALPALRLDAVIAGQKNLVFLGDPGSGKTTLLRWLAVIAAGGRFSWASHFDRPERWIPVPLSVGRIAEIRRSFAPSHPSVVDVAARYFRERNICLGETELREALHEVLSTGEALVLLDGLDEVRSDERTAIRVWLESFAAQYPRCRFFATSREVGFSGFCVVGSEEMHVEPFDEGQIESFVRAFVHGYRRMETGEDDAEASRKAADDFLAALKRDPRLATLAKNPFLLSALALMHRSETRLPRHRVLAYELFARSLCETWADARRLVAGETGKPLISYEDEALPVLGHLALAMHEEHPDGTAPEEFVLDELADALVEEKGISRAEARKAARAFLARAGEEVQILLPRGPDQWGFLHLTFQEFFAAAGLHAQERFEEVLFQRLFDPRWLEVLRLGVGYLALVQKRPKKVSELVLRVLEWKEPEPRAWLTEKLQKQVVRAAQLAAEAGDALRPEVQAQVTAAAAEWLAVGSGDAALKVIESLAGYEITEALAAAFASAAAKSDGANGPTLRTLRLLRSLDPKAAESHALRALMQASAQRVRWLLTFLSDAEIVANLARMPEQARRMATALLAQRRFLENIQSPAAWREAFGDPEPANRDACSEVLAYRVGMQLLENEAIRKTLVDALGDSVAHVRTAAFEALLRSPRWSPDVGAAIRAAGPEAIGAEEASWCSFLVRDAASGGTLEPFLDVLLRQPPSPTGGLTPAAQQLAKLLRRADISGALGEHLVREVRAGAKEERRATAVAALEYWASDEAIAIAAHCLENDADGVRLSALWALGRIDSERACSMWLGLVHSSDSMLRAMALAVLDEKRWLPAKSAILRDTLLDLAERDAEAMVQAIAVYWLQLFHSPQVVEGLERLAKAGRQLDDVLHIMSTWGIEDAVCFVDDLDPQTRLQVLWTLSEDLSSATPDFETVAPPGTSG